MDNRCGDWMVNCYNVDLYVPPTLLVVWNRENIPILNVLQQTYIRNQFGFIPPTCNVGTDNFINPSSQVRKNPFVLTCSRRSPFLNCSFPYQAARLHPDKLCNTDSINCRNCSAK